MTRILTSTLALTLAAGPALTATEGTMSYCDRAFFPVDSNEDGMISASEAEKLRDAQYQGLDANKDGSITREELAACVEQSQSQRAAMQGDADAAFDSIDANNDKVIDAKELQTAAKDGFDRAKADPESVDAGWSEPFVALNTGQTEADITDMSMEEYFAQVGTTAAMTDTNSDGQISREEYSARGDAAQSGAAAETITDAKFEEMDENGDGIVSREEFDTSLLESEEKAREAAKRDGYYDATKGVPASYIYIFAM